MESAGIITVTNHGPLVASSSYWGSAAEAAGKVWCSVNAGAVRVLVPRTARRMIGDMRTAKTVVLSRGPWPAEGRADAVEILFDDDTDSPFCLTLGAESFDVLPAEPEPGREWLLTAWDLKKGVPHKALERPCHWRRVAKIPDMMPWRPQ